MALIDQSHLTRVIRNPTFCICKNKDADREADQRLCFRYIDSTIPLLSKSEISSPYPYENIQQYFSNSMAEIETRFLAGFLLLFSYNNSNTSAIISGKIFKLARILLKILFRL